MSIGTMCGRNCIVLLLLPIVLLGCSSKPTLPEGLADPQTTLQIPPNLTRPLNSGYLQIPDEYRLPAKNSRPRPKMAHITRMREGSNSWLQVNTSDLEQLWPLLQHFWETVGAELALDDRVGGVMETIWFSNNDDRFLQPTKDKFRLRVVVADSGDVAELYISHYGATEEDGSWLNRPRDAMLEDEVLERLAQAISIEITNEQKRQQREQLYKLAADHIVVPDNFARSWRATGIAIDRLGILTKDRIRSKGIYFIQIPTKSLAGDSFRVVPPDEHDNEYTEAEIAVEQQASGTVVRIQQLSEKQQKMVLEGLRIELIR